MKRFKSFLTISLIILALSFNAFAFDKAPGTLDEFGFGPDVYRDLSNSIVSVACFGTALGWYPRLDENDKPIYKAFQGFFKQQGSGVVIKAPNGQLYILTNAHVVIPESLQIAISTSSSLNTPVLKVLKKTIMVGSWYEPTRVECYLVWIDVEADLAILKPSAPQLLLSPIPYPLITFDMMNDLQEGDAIAVVTGVRDEKPYIPGFIIPDRLWYYEARFGKILHNHPDAYSNDILPWFGLNDITTDVKIYPGDSGSPAFAFLNGKPYLIGLFRAVSYTDELLVYATYATRLTAALRYLSTEGLD